MAKRRRRSIRLGSAPSLHVKSAATYRGASRASLTAFNYAMRRGRCKQAHHALQIGREYLGTLACEARHGGKRKSGLARMMAKASKRFAARCIRK